jgi:hypothetical protein
MRRQSPSRPLEGQVKIVGVRPQVSLTERRAKVADLSITLTGGRGPTPVPITFSIGLNVPLSGRAQLTDDAGTVIAESTRSGSALVFRDVPVIPPGSRSRVFRITNIRANASGVPQSASLVPAQIFAFLSISGPLRIPLAGSQQNVGAIRRQ